MPLSLEILTRSCDESLSIVNGFSTKIDQSFSSKFFNYWVVSFGGVHIMANISVPLVASSTSLNIEAFIPIPRISYHIRLCHDRSTTPT